MRRFSNNFGVPPKLLPTTRHLILFDQSGASDAARDLCGYGGNPIAPAAISSPATCDAWGAAGGRLLDGAADYFEIEDPSHADHSAMSGSLLRTGIEVTFRMGAAFSAAGSLACYGGNYDSDTTVFEVHIDADRHPCVEWSHSGSHIVSTFTGVTLRKGGRYQIGVQLDWDIDTLTLWLNGALIETKDVSGSMPDVTAGTMYWRFGAIKGATASRFFNGELYAVRVDTSDTALTIADYREDFRRAQLFSGGSTRHYKVYIEDGAGTDTMQDMGTFCGANWLASCSWTDDADQNMETAQVELFRTKYNISLSRFHNNRANIPEAYPPAIGPGAYVYDTTGVKDMIRERRKIQIYFVRAPIGVTPPDSSFGLGFSGFISDVDWGNQRVKVNCNDKADPLMRATIEHTTHFPTNDVDHSLEDTIRDYSGGAHGILDKVFAEGWCPAITIPTLIVPVATGTTYTHWIQDRQLVFPTLVGIAEQLAFLLRYRWWDATDDFELMLYEPERTRAYEDAFFTAADYKTIPTFKTDASDKRTRARGVFGSTNPGTDVGLTGSEHGGWDDGTGTITTDSEGGPLQYYVEVSCEDVDASWTEGEERQFCELTEGSTLQVSSYVQMDRWLTGIVRDLWQPNAVMAAEMFAFPEIECEDMLYFEADQVHTTVDFRLAVYSKTHSVSEGVDRTSITMRGNPSGGTKRWLSREVATLGIKAGVMTKDDVLTSTPSRAQRTSKWAVIERTGVINSGDSAKVCNKQFQSALCGPNYPFDGWEVVDGAWGTDFDADSTQAIRGAYCLRIRTDPT